MSAPFKAIVLLSSHPLYWQISKIENGLDPKKVTEAHFTVKSQFSNSRFLGAIMNLVIENHLVMATRSKRSSPLGSQQKLRPRFFLKTV
jgi:hypothetical protein